MCCPGNAAECPITGTVGILADAHLAGLLDFEQSVRRLRQTNFYVSDDVVEHVRHRLSVVKKDLRTDRTN